MPFEFPEAGNLPASGAPREGNTRMQLKRYTTTINGYETEVLLSDEDATRLGLLDPEASAADPAELEQAHTALVADHAAALAQIAALESDQASAAAQLETSTARTAELEAELAAANDLLEASTAADVAGADQVAEVGGTPPVSEVATPTPARKGRQPANKSRTATSDKG